MDTLAEVGLLEVCGVTALSACPLLCEQSFRPGSPGLGEEEVQAELEKCVLKTLLL